MIQAGVSGLVSGGVYALLGICLVLTYRMAGVLNLALAAVGAFAAFAMIELQEEGWPYLPAVLAGFAVGGAVAVVLGLAMNRWFGESDTPTRAGVSIAVLVGLLALGSRLFGGDARPFPAILPDVKVRIAGVVLTAATLIALAASVVIAALLTAMLGRTRTGHQLRAVAARPVTAELLGIPVRQLTTAVWAASGLVSTGAVLLIAPVQSSQFSSLSLLVLPATAAALLGAFRSFWLTVAGGIGIGVLSSLIGDNERIAAFSNIIPFVVVVVVLCVVQRREVWDAAR
ncbi:branched-chain amino acid ABC transporter permease [Frankia sp. QA3]|uniref:branched-chain amino acid ABC transporter permease n=1 Tax=Frankia sp. QA3 TaxID=710111 RepID=UPI000269BF7F|nr:branched-chain amino acid ABC transporter permease [Frankia sp. QA3]EIV92864.1 branched-chain amino acid ABC-type transport system, permease component [Frankia sp. QA3]